MRGVVQRFKSVPAGIEQTFSLAASPAGAGPLVIHVGLDGLRASGSGDALALRAAPESAGGATGAAVADRAALARVVGYYAGLHVTDAAGHVLPAHMRASQAGAGIVLTIDDSHARYPLLVDPTIGQTAEINDPNATAGDEFGYAVGISGSTAVVGALAADSGHGAIHIFSNTSGDWKRVATINDPVGGGGDQFGASVAISGGAIVVGDPAQTVGSNATLGAAYVYEKNVDGVWSLFQTLTDANGKSGDLFGASVAISSDAIAIGAPDVSTSVPFVGTVDLYLSSDGRFIAQQRLAPSDLRPFDQMGSTVAIDNSNDTVAAGALNSSSQTQTAYIFTDVNGSWAQAPVITVPDPGDAHALPSTVAADGSTVVVGDQYTNNTSGAAYVYGPPIPGAGPPAWRLVQTLTAADGGGEFGRAIAISGGTMIVGAFGHQGNAGAAYVFTENDSGSWIQQPQDLLASDGATSDDFGWAVALDGDTMFVGAYNHAGGGAAYVEGPLVQPGPTYTVTNFNDVGDGACYVGDCTLRDAINAANANENGSSPDQIDFDIASTGVQPIEVTAPLPAITDPVVIDATTQPGYAGTPIIDLDGTDCEYPCDGLDLNSGTTTIRGLAITEFASDAIALNGAGGNVIQQNWIGWYPGPEGPASGEFDGSFGGGVVVNGSSTNQIGGSLADEGNVIAGNAPISSLPRAQSNAHAAATRDAPPPNYDVLISGDDSSGNVLANNTIALGADGTSASFDGYVVVIDNSASENTIGGSNAQGNVIAGYDGTGVELSGAGAGNVVSGNTIGANASGAVVGDQAIGVDVENSPNTVVGDNAAPGTQADTDNGNEIVGQSTAVQIGSSGVIVAGNYLGTDRTGAANPSLGGLAGVVVTSGSGNVIGPGNTIANSGADDIAGAGTGVLMDTSGNRVTANSIHDNQNVGIVPPPPPVNDVPAPVLVASSPQSGGITAINGTVAGTAGSQIAVEVFDTPLPAGETDCPGQGATFLGSITVTIGPDGTAPVDIAAAKPVLGHVLTATATTVLPGDHHAQHLGLLQLLAGDRRRARQHRVDARADDHLGRQQLGERVAVAGSDRPGALVQGPDHAGRLDPAQPDEPAGQLRPGAVQRHRPGGAADRGHPERPQRASDARNRDAGQRVQPVGVQPVGVLAFGLLAVGVQSVGVLAVGVQSVGVLAVGVQPVGVLPVGVLAFGLFAVGLFAVGVLARRCSAPSVFSPSVVLALALDPRRGGLRGGAAGEPARPVGQRRHRGREHHPGHVEQHGLLLHPRQRPQRHV